MSDSVSQLECHSLVHLETQGGSSPPKPLATGCRLLCYYIISSLLLVFTRSLQRIACVGSSTWHHPTSRRFLFPGIILHASSNTRAFCHHTVLTIYLHSLVTDSQLLTNVHLHNTPLLIHGPHFILSINTLRPGLIHFYKFTTHFCAIYALIIVLSPASNNPARVRHIPQKHAQPHDSSPPNTRDPLPLHHRRHPLRNSADQWLLPRLRECIQHTVVRMHSYRLLEWCLLRNMHRLPRCSYTDHKCRMHRYKC